MSHPSKKVFHRIYRRFVHIDELLAPLIKAMWKAGIHTCECCQEVDYGGFWPNREGKAWIGIEDFKYFGVLTNIVLKADPDDVLTQRTSIYTIPDTMDFVSEGWLTEISPEFFMMHSGEEVLGYSVDWYFPQEDIPILTKRLNEFTGGRWVELNEK